MALVKPKAPQRPDTHKYRETNSFNFEFSSFKDGLLFLFFGCFAAGYLINGGDIENFIHAVVLLAGIGFGIMGGGLVIQSFQFPKKTIRVLKTQSELLADEKFYKASLATYEGELSVYNQKVKEAQEVQSRLEKEKKEEESRKKEAERLQQILVQEKKKVEQEQREKEEKQRKNAEALNRELKIQALDKKRRHDWKDFHSILEENNISKLYHFTDKSNIASIKAHGGLFSWWAAQQNGIVVPKPGGIGFGRDLDVNKSLQNYVRLSFNDKNPMLYVAQKEGRILNPVFLEIDPIVILLASTLFTKENATKNGIYPSSTVQFFKEVVEGIEKDTLHSLRKVLGGGFLINPKAEILVFEKVPLEYITNITSV